MHAISDHSELEELLAKPVVVLFKHSMLCGISHWALIELKRFAKERPEVPVFIVDVLGTRELSNLVASRLGLRHASPQAIVLREGAVIWSGSHDGISAAALGRALLPAPLS